MKLIRSSELAADWDMEESELHRRRRRNGWPCVRLSRSDIRFTEEQIARIVAMQSEEPGARRLTATTGQTARSRKKAS